MSGHLTQIVIRAFDSIARLLPGRPSDPEHLQTDRRGEEELTSIFAARGM